MWFISDSHFGHANIIKFCNRPFSCCEEMDETMIERWNSVVEPKDIVYHLGDFALCRNSYAKSILERLNGIIYLCRGSHDKTVLNGGLSKYFADIRESYVIEYNKQTIYLAHHCHKVWPRSHWGVWHLFGHSHGGLDDYSETEGKLLDVGVDNYDFGPWHIEDIETIMASRPLNFNDLRRKKY